VGRRIIDEFPEILRSLLAEKLRTETSARFDLLRLTAALCAFPFAYGALEVCEGLLFDEPVCSRRLNVMDASPYLVSLRALKYDVERDIFARVGHAADDTTGCLVFDIATTTPLQLPTGSSIRAKRYIIE